MREEPEAAVWPIESPTFMMTDVEGSTRMWEREPARMGDALAIHDRIVSEVASGHGGVVPQGRGEGDSFLVLFQKPHAAVAAAVDLQRRFRDEQWPTSSPIRVRVAVHTGEVEIRPGGHYGPTLNRCARLRATAHGGQSILSAATAEIARDLLPAEVTLADLGFHQLRDLTSPERVFQIVAPDLPFEFPPLRSIQGVSHNLPAQLTTFIDRKSETQAINDSLEKARLVTLTGEGGSGKTRLALESAVALASGYPDGVWLVELAPLTDESLVADAIAAALGVGEEAGRSLKVSLIDFLKGRSALLLLDNCEHVASESASICLQLLRACPSLKILTTSRQPLEIEGELNVRVPPLAVPAESDARDWEFLQTNDAVRLFVDRALASVSELKLGPQEMASIASITRRLEGIPLALELAAPSVKVLSLAEIDRRLAQSFRLLEAGVRALPARHRTLVAAVDWSYQLLDDEEKEFLRYLSVFHGGFTLEAAAAVANTESLQALDLVAGLVGKSLVVAIARGEGTRYKVHETIRRFAMDRLSDAGLEKDSRSRHLVWFASLSEQASRGLEGADQVIWLDRLEDEADNLRASVAWGFAQMPETSVAMVGDLSEWWHIRGHWSEGRGWVDRALESATPHSQRARLLNAAGLMANLQGDHLSAGERWKAGLELAQKLGDRSTISTVLHNLGKLALQTGDYEEALSYHAANLDLANEAGDRRLAARAITHLGVIAMRRGDFRDAREKFDQALSMAEALGEQRTTASVLYLRGELATAQSDYPSARSDLERGLTIARQLRDLKGISGSLHDLGDLARREGDLPSARKLLEESLQIARDLGDARMIAHVLQSQAAVALAAGEAGDARDLYRESLRLRSDLGDKPGIAASLEGLGLALADSGSPIDGARLMGAAEALQAQIGVLASREGLFEQVKQRAAGEDIGAAWEEGRAAPWEETVSVYLEGSTRC